MTADDVIFGLFLALAAGTVTAFFCVAAPFVRGAHARLWRAR